MFKIIFENTENNNNYIVIDGVKMSKIDFVKAYLSKDE
jgi:hypothetical protein